MPVPQVAGIAAGAFGLSCRLLPSINQYGRVNTGNPRFILVPQAGCNRSVLLCFFILSPRVHDARRSMSLLPKRGSPSSAGIFASIVLFRLPSDNRRQGNIVTETEMTGIEQYYSQ
ncbi:hypothetical protein [Sporomusa sp.]|uniref:hypothetical protein n=1 Tax=Sporomusa sp. TaxID=2078658 RepID=UPI002B6E4CDA|nr:hypothetical protein [Sporomusa sp.]HWR43528.1 hypothetical protein [Sporomusa sp.]